MKTISQRLVYFTSLATGVLIIFIGVRFFIVPLEAEAAFGIHTGLTDHLEFHHIKGIRDIASGLLTLVLLFNREFRSLGWLMICMSIIPVSDFLVVQHAPSHPAWAIYPHLTAIIICLTVGTYYLFNTQKTGTYAI